MTKCRFFGGPLDGQFLEVEDSAKWYEFRNLRPTNEGDVFCYWRKTFVGFPSALGKPETPQPVWYVFVLKGSEMDGNDALETLLGPPAGVV